MGCKKLTYFRNDTFLAVVHNTLNINEKCGVSKKRYRYNGKEKDEESGLYYYGMRYYAPWVCRFVSVDPIADSLKRHSPYQYASNDPINKIDVNGLQGVPVQVTQIGEKIETSISSTIHQASESIENGLNTVGEGLKILGNGIKLMADKYSDYMANRIMNSSPYGGDSFVPFDAANLPSDVKESAESTIQTVKEFPKMSAEEKIATIGMVGISAITSYKTMKGLVKPKASLKGPVKLDSPDPNTKSGIDTSPNPKTDNIPTTKAENYVKNAFKEQHIDMDCSDLAKQLFDIEGKGKIIEITPEDGKWFKGYEYGEVTEFQYHQVFEKDGMIYDPMFSDKPIPKGEFMKTYKDINTTGLKSKTVAEK